MDGCKTFALERQFTALYRKLEGAHPAEREIACLELLRPAELQPLQDGDLLAGRIRMSRAGFSPEPGGLGYYCDEEAIRRDLDGPEVTPAVRRDMEELLDFWRTESTTARVRAAYPPEVTRALPSDNWITEPLPASPLYRMAGSYLDFATLLRLGLPGLRKAVASRRAQAEAEEDDITLYTALDLALELLARCCLAYRTEALALAQSDSPARPDWLALAETLQAITEHAPATLAQAMQLLWLYALVSGTFNYGRLDKLLGGFLAADLAAGRLSRPAAQRLFNSLWRLIADRKTIWNGRVILGGRDRSETADEAALMALEATRAVPEVEPQLSLRLYKGIDHRLPDKALELLGEGRTYPILYNDEVNVPAVAAAMGVSQAETQEYLPFGCGEYVLDHRSFGSPNGILNLLKVLELTLRDGRDPLTGRQMGPHTGRFENFASFEELWQAYTCQADYFVTALARQEAIEYKVAGETAPFLYFTLLYDDCLQRGKGIFAGGIRYLGGTVETYGNINTADSLTAIRELVYRRGAVTPSDLLAALDADFEGWEDLRRQLLQAPKYGNDDPVADGMAAQVHEQVCSTVRSQAGKVGLSSYLVVIINNSANTTLGRWTAASADGRRKGQYMANGNNPSSGSDRAGLTAMLNSLVKLRPDCHAGAVQNIKLSPAWFAGDAALARGLLQAYFDQGGTQAMLSVVRRGDLEKALQNPEQYHHLMVRVGGFSARFVELEPDVQQEILHRTLY